MLRQAVSVPARAARLAARAPLRATATATATATTSPAALAASTSTARRSLLAARSPSPLWAGRWYSSAADEKAAADKSGDAKEAAAGDAGADAAAAEAQGGEAATPEAADVAALRQEVESKTKEAMMWKDKYLRAVADFRNLQERTQREMKAARDFAITQFAKDLVDSVDNLDRALANVPEAAVTASAASAAGAEGAEGGNQDLANLVDGIRMTETVLLQTLKKHGLERFDPAGEKFNPNEHEATFMTPMPDKEHNTVVHTQQKGFRLNGRVLRAAKVGVVNNK